MAEEVEIKALVPLTVDDLVRIPLIYQGERVITLPQMDRVHGRPDNTAASTFHRHRNKLSEDIDYFRVGWDDPVFGTTLNVAPKGGHHGKIILLAESGYLMLVKPWNDALAWEVQRRLVNEYFRSKLLTTSSQVEHFLPVVKAIEAMGENIIRLNGNIENLNGNLSSMSESNRKEHDDIKCRLEKVERVVEGIQPRRNFSPATIDQYVQTLMLYFNGQCPCCRDERVLDENGNKISGAEADHFYGASHNAVHEGWIVGKKCNQRLFSEDGFREKVRTLFHAFHVYREMYLRNKSPELPFDDK